MSDGVMRSDTDSEAMIRLGETVAGLRSAKEAYQGRLFRNGVLFSGGLIASLWTWFRAAFSSHGGVYFVFFGAVVIGAGNAYVAARHYLRTKRRLSEIDAQYGSDVVASVVSAWADQLLASDTTGASDEASGAPESGVAEQSALSQGTARVVGTLVLVLAAAVIVVPAVLIVSSGSGAALQEDFGTLGSFALGFVDVGVAALLGYVGWRYVSQPA